ncbi:hypothetical protein [uncultured Cohaesibacter sp.]|uniref:hypothetical protein n=1 Tax=uncultured Cohaesibacter sp. TaxID=1002546 RepID=UPI00292D97B6|nr:hypothetical protein [uncultured Cohaesibacter sp.]
MSNLQITLLSVALLMSAATTCLHVILGGRGIAKPLMQSGLEREMKNTLYFCWHFATLVLIVMTCAFAVPFFHSNWRELVGAASLLAGLIAAWNIAFVLTARLPFKELPQWILFVGIALPGSASLFV